MLHRHQPIRHQFARKVCSITSASTLHLYCIYKSAARPCPTTWLQLYPAAKLVPLGNTHMKNSLEHTLAGPTLTCRRAVSSGSEARCWMASFAPVRHVKVRSCGANITPKPRTSRTTACTQIQHLVLRLDEVGAPQKVGVPGVLCGSHALDPHQPCSLIVQVDMRQPGAVILGCTGWLQCSCL